MEQTLGNKIEAATESRELEEYFRGEKLYGNDFTPEQVEQWFKDEERCHFELGSGKRSEYVYGNHALNERQAFRFLPNRRFEKALGFGAGYGEEFLPIVDRIGSIVVIEPVPEYFIDKEFHGVPISYVKPEPSGKLPFPDATFDLITSFAVLHHIANVSYVLREIGRCLAPGGYFLIREPSYSMGDWRYPRAGLTTHERGIPGHLLQKYISDAGMEVVRARKTVFNFTWRLKHILRRPPMNYPFVAFMDDALCQLPFLSTRYHAMKRLRATALQCVATKR